MTHDQAHTDLTERNRQLVEDFYSGVITGEPANPARLFADDITVYEPYVLPWGGTYVGTEGQEALGAAQGDRMVRGSLEVLALHADGDTVISELRIKMTASGEDLLLSEHMKVADGHITQQRVYVFGNPSTPLDGLL